MKYATLKAFILLGFLAVLSGQAPSAQAAERTVTLKVDMWCPSCSYIIKRTLIDLQGVDEVLTSYEKQIAVVRFDDEQTNETALTQATADIGFPSTVLSSDGD